MSALFQRDPLALFYLISQAFTCTGEVRENAKGDSMNRIIRILLVAAFPMPLLHAAESVLWNTANNSVTYSTSINNLTLGSTATLVSLSQFNSQAVAAQEGGSAGQYTLSSAVLTLDGSVYGTIVFHNNGPISVSPTYDFSGYSKLTYGAYSTPKEYYDGNAVALGTVDPGAEVSVPVSSSGDGAVSTANITSALASFIGSSTIETSLYFPVTGLFDSGGTVFTTTLALRGSADVSVTYSYAYDPIPEPTSLALLGFGCAALLTRRRFKRQSFGPQGHTAPNT